MVPIVDPGGDLARAIVDSYRGVLDLIGQSEGARVERERGYVRWTSGIRLPLFNGGAIPSRISRTLTGALLTCDLISPS